MPLYETNAGPIETIELGETDTGVEADLAVLLHAAATGPGSLVRLGRAIGRSGRWRVVIPALHGYGRTAISDGADAIDRHAEIARWALSAFPGRRRVLFGQSMGGLAALIASWRGAGVDHLALYEPMAMMALDPDDAEDTRERDWDRALVRAVVESVGTPCFEAAVGAFVEAWNEVAWLSMPENVRRAILDNPEALVAELAAVNHDDLKAIQWSTVSMPCALLGGTGSPALAGRILNRLERGLPAAKRFTLKGLGHMGPVLQPEVVAGCLLDAMGEAK